MTITLETTATLSAVSNNALAEAFTEVAELIACYAHLPAVSHGTFSMYGSRPRFDLWFKDAEHVEIWADVLGTAAIESDSVHETERPFTTTEAVLPDRFSAELKLTHLRYRDETADA